MARPPATGCVERPKLVARTPVEAKVVSGAPALVKRARPVSHVELIGEHGGGGDRDGAGLGVEGEGVDLVEGAAVFGEEGDGGAGGAERGVGGAEGAVVGGVGGGVRGGSGVGRVGGGVGGRVVGEGVRRGRRSTRRRRCRRRCPHRGRHRTWEGHPVGRLPASTRCRRRRRGSMPRLGP